MLIQSGGTKTNLTIIDDHGEVLGRLSGGPSNPWIAVDSVQ